MPLFWLSLALLLGILLSAYLRLSTLTWCIIGITGVLLIIPAVYQRWMRQVPMAVSKLNQSLKITSLRLYPLFLVFISFGAIRWQGTQPRFDPSTLAYYNDQAEELILEGVIIDPPDVRDTYSNLRLEIDQVQTTHDDHSTAAEGMLLVKVAPGTNLRYGDRVRLQGDLQTPPEGEDFSYRDYLAHQSVFSMMSFPEVSLLKHDQGNPFFSALYAFRDRGEDEIYRFFPDPEASLISGIILGVQSGIPEQVNEAFRLTGTSHIIVISGFNITIIAGMLTQVFSRMFGRYKGAIAAAVGIALYTLLVGANPAVVRAAILGMFSILGHLIGRRQAGLNSLAIVAGVMAAITPTILWDVSFQLSFAATMGIMLYVEPLTDWFIKTSARFMPQERAEKLAGPVGEYFLITLAAQLTTLPLMIYYFKRVSLTALVANPLILPAQLPLMVLGGLAVLMGVFIQPIGQLFAWAALPFAAYTIRVVEWFAHLPHGSLPLDQLALPVILIFYLCLFTFTFARSRISSLVTRFSPAIPLAGLMIATFIIWKAGFSAPDGLLHVTLFDVGAGEAVFIQSPTGRYVLINGGSSTIKLSDALGRRMPPFHRSLDWLLVAGTDNEDLAGIPGNLERFPPDNVLWAGNTYGTRSASNLWSELIAKSTSILHMERGQTLDLGSGAVFHVLSTTQQGGVLLLEWNNFRLLLPVGMDFDALESLSNDKAMRSISAVMLAESGYGPLNTPGLISNLHPQLALLSVALADRSGLPSPETLEALKGYSLLRTDVNGWIEIVTNGKQMWVETEK